MKHGATGAMTFCMRSPSFAGMPEDPPILHDPESVWGYGQLKVRTPPTLVMVHCLTLPMGPATPFPPATPVVPPAPPEAPPGMFGL